MPYHPQYLIIPGGTNSLRGDTPASKVIEDLAAIRPIFLTLSPINPEDIVRAFNEETASNWRQEFDGVNKFIRQQRYYIDVELPMSNINHELPH